MHGGYALNHAPDELERLTAQARLFEPFTRQFLQQAGLVPGMRVLEVGTGAGDVAFLAAALVGPTGEVVGVDRAPEAVAAAEARARQFGLHNVTFRAGDPAEMDLGRSFDAVIGRLVLMFYPDPAAALRRLVRGVRSGGVVAFQEFDLYAARSYPPSPLFEQCLRWTTPVLERTGADVRLGLKLRQLFVEAGLSRPELRLDAAVGGGPGYLAYLVVTEVVRTLLPLIEKFGLATAEEVGIETLRTRLDEEVAASEGVIVSPSLIGAWATVI